MEEKELKRKAIARSSRSSDKGSKKVKKNSDLSLDPVKFEELTKRLIDEVSTVNEKSDYSYGHCDGGVDFRQNPYYQGVRGNSHLRGGGGGGHYHYQGQDFRGGGGHYHDQSQDFRGGRRWTNFEFDRRNTLARYGFTPAEMENRESQIESGSEDYEDPRFALYRKSSQSSSSTRSSRSGRHKRRRRSSSSSQTSVERSERSVLKKSRTPKPRKRSNTSTPEPRKRSHTSTPVPRKRSGTSNSKPRKRSKSSTSTPEPRKRSKSNTSTPEPRKRSKSSTSTPEPRRRSNTPEPRRRSNTPEPRKRSNTPEPLKRSNIPEPRRRSNTPEPRKRSNIPESRKRSNTPEPRKRSNIPEPRKQSRTPRPRNRSKTPEPVLRNPPASRQTRWSSPRKTNVPQIKSPVRCPSRSKDEARGSQNLSNRNQAEFGSQNSRGFHSTQDRGMLSGHRGASSYPSSCTNPGSWNRQGPNFGRNRMLPGKSGVQHSFNLNTNLQSFRLDGRYHEQMATSSRARQVSIAETEACQIPPRMVKRLVHVFGTDLYTKKLGRGEFQPQGLQQSTLGCYICNKKNHYARTCWYRRY